MLNFDMRHLPRSTLYLFFFVFLVFLHFCVIVEKGLNPSLLVAHEGTYQTWNFNFRHELDVTRAPTEGTVSLVAINFNTKPHSVT